MVLHQKASNVSVKLMLVRHFQIGLTRYNIVGPKLTFLPHIISLFLTMIKILSSMDVTKEVPLVNLHPTIIDLINLVFADLNIDYISNQQVLRNKSV